MATAATYQFGIEEELFLANARTRGTPRQTKPFHREVERTRAIVAEGTSADRQLAIFAEQRAGGADKAQALAAVIDWTAEATSP